MKPLEGRNSRKKYWLGVIIYKGSVDLRNGRKRQFGKNGLVWTIIYVQNADFKFLDWLPIKMKPLEDRKSRQKYWLAVIICSGSVDLRNVRKRQFRKNRLVWPIIYVQNADFKILDWLPFKMKPLEGRKTRKKYWMGVRIYSGSYTFETVVNDNLVKRVLFDPSYTFRMRISKSEIDCHSKWNL